MVWPWMLLWMLFFALDVSQPERRLAGITVSIIFVATGSFQTERWCFYSANTEKEFGTEMVIISKIECHPGVNVLKIKPSESSNRAYVLCTIFDALTYAALLETSRPFTLNQIIKNDFNVNCIRIRTEIDLNKSEINLRHTSELDRSEIDLSPKRSECERSNATWDRSKIDLNVWTLSQSELRSISDRSNLDWS